jgi:hypothetical protein
MPPLLIHKGGVLVTKSELYEKAYEMLEKTTPLLTDCGELCNRACCITTEEDLGMYLFPGEEEMYEGEHPWLHIEKTSLTYGNGKPVFLATCDDHCPRELRPLACRIFPLTPYIERNKTFVIRSDPRAVPICPLARESSSHKLDENFIDAVANAFRLLIKDSEIRSFILKLSRSIDEQESFILRMTGTGKGKKGSRAARRRYNKRK